MKKRLIALLMVGVLCTGLIGCGKKAKNEEFVVDEGKLKQTETVEEVAEEAPAEEPTEPESTDEAADEAAAETEEAVDDAASEETSVDVDGEEAYSGTYRVVLTEVGPNKIKVIKAVREAMGYGLKESKDLVEAAEVEPAVLAENVTEEEGTKIRKAIEAECATVILEEENGNSSESEESAEEEREDLLKVLEDYNVYDQDLKIMTTECTEEEYEAIPDQWKGLLDASLEDKVNIITEMWEAAVKDEMSLTIGNLGEHLEDVQIVRFDDKYALIYVIKNSDGEWLYYIGGAPVESFTIEDDIPESIKGFYTNLHNGFYDYCYDGLGLTELEKVGILYDYTGDELYDEFKRAYCFFDNNMGDYVAYDAAQQQTILWYEGEEPDYGNEFWDLVDEWTNIGLGESN